MVLGHSREPPGGERSTVTVPSGASPCRWPNGQLEQSGAGVMYENLRIHGATFRSKPVGFSSAVFCCGGVGDNHYCHTIDGWRHCRNDCRRLVSTGLTYGQRENPQLQSGSLLPQWRSDDNLAAAAHRPCTAWACNKLQLQPSSRFSINLPTTFSHRSAAGALVAGLSSRPDHGAGYPRDCLD